MAKNKNRDRNQQQKGAQAAERGREEAQKSAMEAQASAQAFEATPSDVARKHQRRFGHN
ncbi:hypothetical protein [Streptomyces sp. WAC 06725]|uniref:hypothetical protein n=1 Tax=Streptomyces sp. WAC 06725 TaxID=2203209 RepID=UPI00163B7B35|nr:hypothetical protein [Streptomyces sp. WAC 06725]